MAAISLKPKTSLKTNTTANGNGLSNAALKSNDTNCIVSKGASVEGMFHSAENVRLDGRIKGDLKCDKRLVMGESGTVEGTVLAQEAVIMGNIKGNITINGTLSLMKTARIEGDIKAQSITVEEGALYNGKCQIGA
ncbi:MAG TPA: polymer-forming cytoskeletal protein [Saprospiraceae bacterium]|nr:polymer-forming cytoskeletal protein [Saprospiraceae bacterium]HMQ81355.1 polymer-forming cytoskeletal protein [Saprospiraceae bacterium]